MSKTVVSIQVLLLRDLSSLKEEIMQYKCAEDLWLLHESINNSGGNLCLHICGNLQHFIGSVIGESGYVRDRTHEFGAKELSIVELVSEISKTEKALIDGLQPLTDDRLEEVYPLEVFGEPMTFGYFLIHLSGHLMYHLGQINYHRRLLGS